MEIRFTKGAGKYDRMEVVRDNGGRANVDCPKQGIIPHDMVHYAVESVLAKRGFIARVAAGEVAAFNMNVEDETDGVERLVEVLQADGWSGWQSTAEDILSLYKSTCGARSCHPLDVGANDIEVVRERILALTAQWEAIPTGGALSLVF